MLFTEGEKLEDAGAETIARRDTAPIQASPRDAHVNVGAELRFSNYCRPNGVWKDEKALLLDWEALRDRQEPRISPHHDYSRRNNKKGTKGPDTLSGCICHFYTFASDASLHTEQRDELGVCLFCFLLQVEYLKKILEASNMRKWTRIWSDKITSEWAGRVSELLSVWERSVCVRGSAPPSVRHENDQTKGPAANMWRDEDSIIVYVWKKKETNAEIMKIKKEENNMFSFDLWPQI